MQNETTTVGTPEVPAVPESVQESRPVPKPLTKAQMREREKSEARQELRRLGVRPGKIIYTILKHRSDSGMMRVIDAYIIKQGVPLRISWSVARLTGMPYNNKHEGVQVGGCGMDAGFHLVYCLSSAMYPHGHPCNKKDCHSNDHRNSPDVKKKWHSDGGYALKQQWM